MHISFSDLVGLSVGALNQSKKAATVCGVVFDPDSGKAIALLVKINPLSLRPDVISWLDVREISKEAVIITDEDSILPINELVRAEELYNDGFDIIGLPVFTKRKKKLGKDVDYSVDTESGSLISISVHGLWGYKAIFNRANIYKIQLDKIIVKSDVSSKELLAEPSPEMA